MDKIISLISKGENQTVEFKTSFQKEVIESVVAFANAKGGKIFIGVKDNGIIQGIDINQESLKDWINQIKVNTQPQILVDIEKIEIENKTIAVVDVKEYPIKPIAYKNRYYKRVQNSNHLMDLIEITNMNLQSLQLSWDSYVAQDTYLDDLDAKKIEIFFQRVDEKGRFRLSGTTKEKLQKLNLIQGKAVSNAAKLLFAKELNTYTIHLGRFKTPSMIIDDKIIKSTLFEAVEESMRFIISHLKVAFEFTGEIERKEIFEYPIKAIRELLLNAIVHRDYTSPIDIQIKIFDNSITMFNPGKLYGDLTIEELHTDEYQSRARNKLVVEAFYLTGDIEKYGSGYIRVREEIQSYPTMLFEYKESGDGYLVKLSYTEQKTTQKTTQKSTREQIIELLKADKKLTRSRLAQAIGVSPDAIKQHLAKLQNDKFLKRVGGRKDGYWEVLE